MRDADPPANDRRLVIERLALAGFGPYRGRVEVLFPHSLGVMVGPNERGKSTLIAGITAVLFGLPHVTDAGAFGVERYRNRRGTLGAFEGEVIVWARGDRFRVRRDFETHRVTLAREVSGSWHDEIVGEHNPNARKPNARYEAWLTDIIAHASRSLFEATFCLTQVYDQSDSINKELQALLAGSSAGGYETALKQLQEAAKEITRGTGVLGLTPRDGRKSGRLDDVEAEIHRLERGVEQSRQAVDAFQRTATELQERSVALDKERERLGRLRQTAGALRQWRQLKQRIEEREAEVASLKRSVREYAQLDAEQNQLARERESRYPEFGRAPRDLDETLQRLADLVRITGEVGRLRADIAQLDEAIERTKAQASEAFDVCVDDSARSWMKQTSVAWRHVCTDWQAFEGLYGEMVALESRRDQVVAHFEEAAPARLERFAGVSRPDSQTQRVYTNPHLQELIEASLKNDADRDGIRQRLRHYQRRVRRNGTAILLLLALAVMVINAMLAGGRRLLEFVVLLLPLGGAAAAWWTPGAREARTALRASRKREVELEREYARIAQDLGSIAELSRSEREALIRRIDAHHSAIADLETRKADLEAAVKRMYVRWFGRLPEESAHIPETPCRGLVGSWRDFAQAMEMWGRRADTLSELASLATELNDDFWNGQLERARRADHLREECRELELRRYHLVGNDPRSASAGTLSERLAEIDRLITVVRTDVTTGWERVRRAAHLGDADSMIRSLPQPYGALLAAADWDLDTVRRRRQSWTRLFAEEERHKDSQSAMLRAWGVEGRDLLEGRLATAESRLTLAIAEMDRLMEEHPGLPSWQSVENVDEIDARIAALHDETDALESRVNREEQALLDLRRRQAELQGASPLNVAEGELSIETRVRERDRLRVEVQAMALAYTEISDVAAHFNLDFTGHLARAASGHFASLTGTPGRQVLVTDDMRFQVREEDGGTLALSQLSQGARDQLYLSVRLAVAELLEGECRAPFILDDPFLHYDAARRRSVRDAITRIASDRQVLIFTHSKEMAAWGEPLEVRELGAWEGVV